MRTWVALVLVAVPMAALLLAGCDVGPPQPVGTDEAAQWMRRVIPLPKQAAIEQKVIASADQVHIIVRADATELERCAAGEIAQVFKEKTGKEATVSSGSKGGFEILLGVCDAGGSLMGRPFSRKLIRE